MSTFGSIVYGLGGIFHTLLQLYIWVVIIAALLSWVRPDPYNPIVQILHRLTEPAYRFVRRLMPTVFNGIDLTALVIIVVLQVVDVLFVNLLGAIARSL